MPIRLNGKAEHIGRVLTDREENYYDDSDFYAVYWDDRDEKCKRITYNTTRFAGGGTCTVDATPEIREKAKAWLADWMYEYLLCKDELESRQISEGKMVKVVRGRKVPHGTKGKVFKMIPMTFSPRYNNGYKQGPDTVKVGIATSNKKGFVGKIEYKEGFYEIKTPWYSKTFVDVCHTADAKWDGDKRVWVTDSKKLVAQAKKTFQSYVDVAWTYDKNIEVLSPSDYHKDPEELKEAAKRWAESERYQAVFSRCGAIL